MFSVSFSFSLSIGDSDTSSEEAATVAVCSTTPTEPQSDTKSTHHCGPAPNILAIDAPQLGGGSHWESSDDIGTSISTAESDRSPGIRQMQHELRHGRVQQQRRAQQHKDGVTSLSRSKSESAYQDSRSAQMDMESLHILVSKTAHRTNGKHQAALRASVPSLDDSLDWSLLQPPSPPSSTRLSRIHGLNGSPRSWIPRTGSTLSVSVLPTPPRRVWTQWKRVKDGADAQIKEASKDVPVLESPSKRDAGTIRPLAVDKDPSVAMPAVKVAMERVKQDSVEDPFNTGLVHQEQPQETKLSRSLLDRRQQAESVQTLFSLVSQRDAEQASGGLNKSKATSSPRITAEKSRSSFINKVEGEGDVGGARIGGQSFSMTASDSNYVLLESRVQSSTVDELTSGE